MKHLITVALLVSSVACTEKGSNAPAPAPAAPIFAMPNAISERPIQSRPALSSDQMASIYEFATRMALIPDTSLILEPSDETADARDLRYRRINELTRPQHQILLNIQNRCQLVKPVTRTEGTLLNVGSVKKETSTGAISGANCAVQYSGNDNAVSTMIESNNTALNAEYQRTRNPDTFAKFKYSAVRNSDGVATLHVRDFNLQQLSRLVLVETSGTSQSSLFGDIQGTTDNYTKTSYSYRVTLVDGSIVTYTTAGESLSRPGQKSSYMEIDLKFPNANPIVQVFADGKSRRIYLNGFRTTEVALAHIFGEKFAKNLTE